MANQNLYTQDIDDGGNGGNIDDLDPLTGKPRRATVPSTAPPGPTRTPTIDFAPQVTAPQPQTPMTAGTELAGLVPPRGPVAAPGQSFNSYGMPSFAPGEPYPLPGGGIDFGDPGPFTPTPWPEEPVVNPLPVPTATTTPAPQPTSTPAPTSSYRAPMTGFDTTKLSNPEHMTPKYQIGRVLQGFNPSEGFTPAVLDALNKLGIGTFSAEGDRLSVGGAVDPRFEGMTSWDSIFSLKDPKNAQWSFGVDSNLDTPGGGPGAPRIPSPEATPTPTPTLPDMPTPGVPSAPSAPTPTPGSPGLQDPRWNDLYDELIKRSQQSLTVNPDDPAIKGQVDAQTAIANREALKQQQTAAARGGPYATGALANTQRMSNEAVQLQAGAMQSELMGREIAARRAEIAAALQQRQGILTVDEQSRLRQADQALQARQTELADKHASFSDALQREIAQNNFAHMAWQRMFQDRGWESDLAQRNWENERSLWM